MTDTDSVALCCGEESLMSRDRRRYTPEFRDEAVQVAVSSNQPIARVARDLGINDGTLGNWVMKWRSEHAGQVVEAPLSVSERAELAQLRRDAATLRMERDFLKKAAAFFATEMHR